tara:strand:- start:3 stop:332 length:330 start_codon:yes stop_codon:yes gene_type:complete
MSNYQEYLKSIKLKNNHYDIKCAMQRFHDAICTCSDEDREILEHLLGSWFFLSLEHFAIKEDKQSNLLPELDDGHPREAIREEVKQLHSDAMFSLVAHRWEKITMGGQK